MLSPLAVRNSPRGIARNGAASRAARLAAPSSPDRRALR